MTVVVANNCVPLHSSDLFRSFRSHAEEIIAFLKKAQEDGAFSDDVIHELDRTCRLLKEAGKTLGNLPEFTDSSYFRLIEQNAYRDPKFAALAAMAKQMIPNASK